MKNYCVFVPFPERTCVMFPRSGFDHLMFLLMNFFSMACLIALATDSICEYDT